MASPRKYQIILILSAGPVIRELKENFEDEPSFIQRLDRIHYAMKHHGSIHFDGYTITASFPFSLCTKNLTGPTHVGIGYKTAIQESYDWIFNQGKEPR